MKKFRDIVLVILGLIVLGAVSAIAIYYIFEYGNIGI